MASLLVKEMVAGKGAPIPDDEKRLLNRAIPEDLTAEEIEEMSTLVASQGSTPRDRVIAVLEALQIVRPNGERKARATGSESGPDGEQGGTGATRDERPESEGAETAPRSEPKRQKPPRSRLPARLIVDPAPILRKVITIDERTRQPIVPKLVEFPGFTAQVAVTGVAQLFFPGSGDGEPTFMIKVLIIPNEDAPRGTMLVGGHPIKRHSPLPDIAVDGIRSTRAL